jgi:hypothetical protein
VWTQLSWDRTQLRVLINAVQILISIKIEEVVNQLGTVSLSKWFLLNLVGYKAMLFSKRSMFCLRK